jgi:hypothetical protein
VKAHTDEAGKVWIAVNQGEIQATFAIAAIDGVPFGPWQDVEIDDARIQAVAEQLLASFGAQSMPVVESA